MIEILIFSIILILLVSGLMVSLLGLITIVQFIKTKPAPMDSSNRINHIRLWWFALTRPELFTGQFPWLKQDELDNITR